MPNRTLGIPTADPRTTPAASRNDRRISHPAGPESVPNREWTVQNKPNLSAHEITLKVYRDEVYDRNGGITRHRKQTQSNPIHSAPRRPWPLALAGTKVPSQTLAGCEVQMPNKPNFLRSCTQNADRTDKPNPNKPNFHMPAGTRGGRPFVPRLPFDGRNGPDYNDAFFLRSFRWDSIKTVTI